jgi:hypothetical protein
MFSQKKICDCLDVEEAAIGVACCVLVFGIGGKREERLRCLLCFCILRLIKSATGKAKIITIVKAAK